MKIQAQSYDVYIERGGKTIQYIKHWKTKSDEYLTIRNVDLKQIRLPFDSETTKSTLKEPQHLVI